MSFPPIHVHEPTASHTHTIILLHGRGSSGPEFCSDLFELHSKDGLTLPQALPHVKWVFPSAKERYSTVFQEDMNEWFDIYSLTDTAAHEELQVEGLRECVIMVTELVEEESKFVGEQNIVLGGISQGLATVMMTLFSYEWRLAGVLGISGWCPFQKHFEEVLVKKKGWNGIREFCKTHLEIKESSLRSDKIPISEEPLVFLGHGRDDAYVDINLGHGIRKLLLNIGAKVEWKDYEGAEEEGHWLKEPEEIDDIMAFLQSRLS